MSLAACGYAEEKEAITGTKWYSEANAYGGAPGEYYYYGPYEGTYEIADGAFLSDESKIQSNIYFVVEDGKVCVCKYDDKLEKGGEFPGENNYIFN